jgi:hypothetical protein
VTVPDITPLTYKFYKGKTKITHDEKMLSQYLPPTYKSRNLEIFYTAKLIFFHNDSGCASDPIKLVLN